MGVYLHLVLSLKKYLYVALQRCTVIQYVYSPCLLVLLNRARAYQRQRSEKNDRASGYNVLPCAPM
jgi:hypothetical protein